MSCLLETMFVINTLILMMNSFNGQPFNQPKFCPSATWNPNATTFAQNYTATSSNLEVIFIDKNNNIYVSMLNLQRVQVWTNGNIAPSRNITNGLNAPQGLFVASNGDIYIDNGWANKRVDKWTVNATSGVMVMNVTGQCYGLFIDTNDTLYCSIGSQNKVVKVSLTSGVTTPTIAAGNGTAYLASNTLNGSHGIFVDRDFNLYVADCGNNRIQLFRSGQLNGSTIAGVGAPATITLNCPTGIMFDADGYLFIVELYGSRIVGSDVNGYRCLVGCSGAGTTPSTLHGPYSFSFDTYGNIFVTDQWNNRIQKFSLATNSCGPSYNQPKLCSSSTWNPNAVTFANASTIGTNLLGLFVDSNNTIYVLEQSFNRVQLWLEGSTTPTRTISGGLNTSYSVVATLNGDVYIDNGQYNGRVDVWTLNAVNSSVSMLVIGCCYDLFVDINNNIYCSLQNNHAVVKKSLDNSTSSVITVAGTGLAGASSTTLHSPGGIFVDTQLNLYVADSWNNRIQYFRSGSLNATTISINGTNGTIVLNYPIGIILDADGYLFIADSNKNRIIGSNMNGFHCIVGCTGLFGTAANLLYTPVNLRFDSYGNLFVVDQTNRRIQKFFLQTNSCSETTVVPTNAPSTIATNIATTSHQHQINETTTSYNISNSTITTNIVTASYQYQNDETTTSYDISISNTPTDAIKSIVTTNIATTFYSYANDETTISKDTSTDVLKSTSTAVTTNVATTAHQSVGTQTSSSFTPRPCSTSISIGSSCNISNAPCDILDPCQNSATCINTNLTLLGYMCSCLSGFNGTECQFDNRPCQPNTCWNNGICNETSNKRFVCLCRTGWQGTHCEIMVNYCENITCFNGGICRPSFLDFTCLCLGDSYSGQYCEIKDKQMVIHEIACRSFAYVAIIALTSVATFIIVMDLLKYCCGIDPVGREIKRRRKKRKKKQSKTKQSSIPVRYIYVHAPLT